jgi:hypothetical protein
MTNELPEPHFRARKDDPYTSVQAAMHASRASGKAVSAVAKLMNDGEGRIDYEIWQDCREAGYISSFTTVRHGRLALSSAGLLVETGETRQTPDGLPSRVWIRLEGVVLPEKVQRPKGAKARVRRPPKEVIAIAVQDLRALYKKGVPLSESIQTVARWLTTLTPKDNND